MSCYRIGCNNESKIRVQDRSNKVIVFRELVRSNIIDKYTGRLLADFFGILIRKFHSVSYSQRPIRVGYESSTTFYINQKDDYVLHYYHYYLQGLYN